MPSLPGQPTALPFDDIRSLFRLMPSPDEAARSAVALRNGELTKPAGSLGRLEDLAQWLAAWQGQASPAVNRPLVAIFASAHGVAAQSVSAYPSAVNAQMLDNFTKGGAAINQICMTNDIGLKVFDLAIDMPTPDITEDDAFDEAGCAATIAFGMEAIAGADLLCLGEMGIGNTTVASAIVYALYGGKAEDWVGAGTGVTGEALARKVKAVEQAVARLKDERDPLEILRRIGGREIAALVGAIIAGRLQKVPILLDGFVVSAAAALVHAMDATALDHCQAAHVSAEAAHRAVLSKIGKEPLLDLGLRLGEGTGAALAVSLVRTAAAVHNGMATFDSAGISRAI